MRLYLTGFMGSGKTAVGERVAARLGWRFLDLDRDIERRAGSTVREIFAREGEGPFRQLEREALAATLELDDVVVATGGGTVLDPRNRELIGRNGLLIWLNPAFATIVGRIGPLGKGDRPLFRDEAQALALYRERLPAYRRSDWRIDIGPHEVAEEVAARIVLRLTKTA
jgi:shikimate kinase